MTNPLSHFHTSRRLRRILWLAWGICIVFTTYLGILDESLFRDPILHAVYIAAVVITLALGLVLLGQYVLPKDIHKAFTWRHIRAFAASRRCLTRWALASSLVFAACFAYTCRGIAIHDSDLFHFGNYPRSWCYLQLNWGFFIIDIDTYDPASVRAPLPHGWFFSHIVGGGGIWANPEVQEDSQKVWGWQEYASITDAYQAGRWVHRYYRLNLPFFVPLVGLLSLIPTIRWTRACFRFTGPPGLCTKCGYDLRAHIEEGPSTKCPECGTPVRTDAQAPAKP